MGKNSVFLGLMLAVVSLLYSSCEDGNSIGFPVGERKIQTIFLDTFTVKTSTVLLDSISTNGSGRILIGEYHDPVFGKTSSSSFLQLGTSDAYSFTPQAAAVFDSIVLILKYDKYFYGDTMQIQNLAVHELSELITPRQLSNSENYSYFFSGGLFNRSKTNSYPTPLGTRSYRPKPMSKGKISIRLNDLKGKQWFDIAKGGNKSPLASDNFLDLFKGVKISTPASANAAVIGFVSDSTVMRIYYSQPDTEGNLVQSHFDFKTYNNNLQYNQVNTDRTGTPLQNLVSGSPVPSEMTNNETFIHSGAGVLTKVEFPNFQYLTNNNEQFMILSARLVVMPITANQLGQKKIPSDLGLLLMNKANIPIGPMAIDFDPTRPQGSFLWHLEGNSLEEGEDIELNKTTQYYFSVIEYTQDLINKKPGTVPSILLYAPTGFSNSTTQLRIGNGINQDSKIKLEIYLSRLNNR